MPITKKLFLSAVGDVSFPERKTKTTERNERWNNVYNKNLLEVLLRMCVCGDR